MSNTLGGDTLAVTMCTMTDMQEIEVAEEYTKGFYKLVDAGYGLVTDTPELINDIKNGDIGEFSTDFVSDILIWSNPLNPMPNLSNDIRQNYFEDSWLGFSFDEFFGGE